MEKKSIWHLNLLGIIFLFLAIISIVDSIIGNRSYDVFWFCNICMLIIGIGMLVHNSAIIESQLLIVLIPDLFWSIDFISYIISGNTIFGFTDWVFLPGPLMPKIITLQHLFMIPIGIHTLAHLPLKHKKAWVFSAGHVLIFFLLTIAFTSPEKNINCVHTLCGERYDLGPLYPLIWIAGIICMIMLTRFFFIWMEKYIVKHHLSGKKKINFK